MNAYLAFAAHSQETIVLYKGFEKREFNRALESVDTTNVCREYVTTRK